MKKGASITADANAPNLAPLALDIKKNKPRSQHIPAVPKPATKKDHDTYGATLV